MVDMSSREMPLGKGVSTERSASRYFITLYIKGTGKLPRDCAQVEIKGRSLFLAVVDPTDGVTVRRKLAFECLYDAIEEDKTKISVDAEKITHVLRKRTPRPWPVLTASKEAGC